MLIRFLLLLAVCLGLFCFTGIQAQDAGNTDLYSLVLVVSDLQDAKRAMTIHDSDENGFIDSTEQKKLAWVADVAKFDLNRDGRITHLEVALRYAKLREDAGATQFDRNNANKFMRRYDKNGNGQLDPDEIANSGWPADPEEHDTDKDGVITISEMVARFAFNRGLRRELGIEMVDQTAAMGAVNRFDRDKDRKLNAEECKEADLPRDPKEHDENGDKLLSISELAVLFSKARREGGISTQDEFNARKIVASRDFNRDGKISGQELTLDGIDIGAGATVTDFTIYDANKDKTITVAEVAKYLAAGKKEKGFTDEALAEATKLVLRHDTNRNGHIDKEELDREARPGRLTSDVLGKADEDRDGRISRQELAKHLAKQRDKS